MRILDWTFYLPAGKIEGKNQHVDISAAKNLKETNPFFGWRATDRPLDMPSDNLNSAPSTRTSINLFVHTKNLMMKDSRKQEKPVNWEWNTRKLSPPSS